MTDQNKFKKNKISQEANQLKQLTTTLKSQLSEDLAIAERLQKLKRPNRFKNMRGFQINSRYIAGLMPGGDFFDLAQSKDPHCFSVILIQSNRYGLTTGAISLLTQLADHLTRDTVEQSGELAKFMRIFQSELEKQFRDEDRLSIFLGWVNSRTRLLRYLNLGTAMVFQALADQDFIALEHQGEPLSKKNTRIPEEKQLHLSSKSRLALLSGGCAKSLENEKKVFHLLNQQRHCDTDAILNEFMFQIRSQFTKSDDLPAQDCSLLMFDVNAAEGLRIV